MCLAAGSEFLLPVRGFFCLLCREFYGDAICAEEHVTTHTHNEKYKVQDSLLILAPPCAKCVKDSPLMQFLTFSKKKCCQANNELFLYDSLRNKCTRIRSMNKGGTWIDRPD